ncbi:hypothetical protein GX48_07139 [Paracoccidioides brasiliensis]|nr:hypothetical protein GX48_07139 [Paracoccidioides brasiliensis]
MSSGPSLLWESHEAGLLNANGEASRKSDFDYLSKVATAFINCIKEDTIHIEGSSANKMFEAVMIEFRRLSAHPSLFPSDEARYRFWILVNLARDKQIEAFRAKNNAKIMEGFARRANLLAREEDLLVQSLNRPSFKPNLLPWEQFLLKGSPGSGVRLPDTARNATVRLMPIGGVALHLNWLRETKRIQKECENSVLLKGKANAASTSEQSELGKIFIRPEKRVKLCLSVLTIIGYLGSKPLPRGTLSGCPGTFRRHKLNLPQRYQTMPRESTVIDRLENFNDVIEALEGERLADYSRSPLGIRAMLYESCNPDLI